MTVFTTVAFTVYGIWLSVFLRIVSRQQFVDLHGESPITKICGFEPSSVSARSEGFSQHSHTLNHIASKTSKESYRISCTLSIWH